MNNNKWLAGLCAAAVTGLFSAGTFAAEGAGGIAPKTSEFLAETEISGYVDTSYSYNFAGSVATQGNTFGTGANNAFGGSGTGLGPRFNDFTVQQFKLTLEKPLDKSDWAAGYRVDLVGGTDSGWINPGLGAANITLENAYVTFRIPVACCGAIVKMGLYNSPFGNEVFETPSNFNITRSLLFLYAQPRSLTGLEVSYAWTLPHDMVLDTLAGIANGWTAGGGTAGVVDNNASKSFYWQSRLGFWEHKASVAVGAMVGTEQAGNNSNYRFLVDAVATLKPIDKLTISLNGDYGQEGFGGGAAHDTFWGVSGTVDYKWSDLINTSLRGEFFSDNVRDGNAFNTRTGVAGGADIWSFTGTIGFNVWKNLVTRVEARVSQSSSEAFPNVIGDTGNGATFGNAMLAVEAAYLF